MTAPGLAAAGLADVYPDGILMALIRPALAVDSITVGTRLPADVLAVLPYLAAREVPGGGTVDDRFAVAVSLQLDGFAVDRRAARQIVARGLGLLRRAQQLQTVTPDGYLAALTVTGHPAELPPEDDQPDGVYRYLATATAVVRPDNS